MLFKEFQGDLFDPLRVFQIITVLYSDCSAVDSESAQGFVAGAIVLEESTNKRHFF
jgi:hypothetical protein